MTIKFRAFIACFIPLQIRLCPFFLPQREFAIFTLTQKNPLFYPHTLQNRPEFSGQLFNFIDSEPVELVHLIKTIKNFLGVKKPRNIFLPLPIAAFGEKAETVLLKSLLRVGIEAKMPAELMF